MNIDKKFKNIYTKENRCSRRYDENQTLPVKVFYVVGVLRNCVYKRREVQRKVRQIFEPALNEISFALRLVRSTVNQYYPHVLHDSRRKQVESA